MGLGDWILATGQIKQLHTQYGQRVLVVGRGGRPQWCQEVFVNNPRIIQRPIKGPFRRLLNASGVRPYIEAKDATSWRWKLWDIRPGEIWFAAGEKQFGSVYRGLVHIEPNTKAVDGNKAWPFERWQDLVSRFPPRTFVQTGAPGVRWLNGVVKVATTFREAMAVLASSRGFVGSEGAMHHAAAALEVPAVVLWSEYIAPVYTGYDTQVNIRHAESTCGSRVACAGCKESMLAISVDEVEAGLRKIL